MRARLTSPHTRLQLAAVYPTVIFLLESVVFSLIGLQLPRLVRRLAAADEPWVVAAHRDHGHPARGPGRLGAADRRTWPRRRSVTARAGVAGDRGGRLGRHPGRGAAGRRAVHPADRRLGNAAGRPRPGPGAGDRGDRDLVGGAGVHPVRRWSGGAGWRCPARTPRRRPWPCASGWTRDALSYLDDRSPRTPATGAGRPGPPAAAGPDRWPPPWRRRSDGRAEAYRQLWQDVVAVQSGELARLYAADQLSDAAYHQVQRQLDLEHARLADD